MALADMIGHTMTQPPTSIPQETLPGDVVDPWSPSAIPLGPPYQAPPPPVNIPPVEVPHPHKEALEVAATHQLSPEVRPMIKAMDEGYADPKYMKMRDQIREALQNGDEKGVDKLHDKLTKLIRGPQSTWDWYNENVATTGRGGKTQAARKTAGELILSELQALTGLGSGPEIPAEEALHMGLIQPEELVPGRQMQESYGVLRDDGFGPGVVSPNASIIPGALLSPFQKSVVSTKLTGLAKGRQHTDPAGLAEFNRHYEQLIKAHIEKTGLLPTEADKAEFMAIARNQREKEPITGGLQAKKLDKELLKLDEETKRTREQTKTEVDIRPHQIKELQAKTTQLLTRAKLDLTMASDAYRKGELAQHKAELATAAQSLSEMKSQMQAIGFALAYGEFSKDDITKLTQMYIDLTKLSIKIGKEAPFLNLPFLDRGDPNVKIEGVGEPGTRVAPVPSPTTPENVYDDPAFAFAPKIPGLNAPPAAPQLSQQTLTPLTPPPQQRLSERDEAVLAEMARLKKSGLSKEEILHLIEKKFGKAK